MRPAGFVAAGTTSSLVWRDFIRSSVAWSIEPALIGDVYVVSVEDWLSIVVNAMTA